MKKEVELGKTGLRINPVGLGTNAVGGHNLFPNLDEDEGKGLVAEAIDSGINFIDTAYIYGQGRSEELVGQVIAEKKARDKIILATKGAHKLVDGKVEIDNSPEFLKQTVEASLKRLQTDYLDVFYIHFPDEKTSKNEAVSALKELKDAGKINAIGVSNFSLEQLKEANQDGYVDVIQSEYNLLKRGAEEELLPYVVEQGLSLIPYFPLASGLLTGKYRADTEIPESRKKNPLFQGETYRANIRKIEKLRVIAERKQAEVAHIALAWLLARPGIDAVIPGAKRAEQVKHNLNTLQVDLSAEEVAEISAIFS